MTYSTSFGTALSLLVFVDDKVRRQDYVFVPTRVISEKLSVPRPTLAKITSALISQNILESKEGKNGGVRICVDPKEITLNDIFSAIEGARPVFASAPDFDAGGERPDQVRKGTQQLLDDAHSELTRYLSSKTFAEFKKDI